MTNQSPPQADTMFDADEYRRLRESAQFEESKWVLLIKELRARHNVSIYEAQRIALSDPIWRRWVERQINTQPACRKQALRHLRDNGKASLLIREGDSFKFTFRPDR